MQYLYDIIISNIITIIIFIMVRTYTQLHNDIIYLYFCVLICIILVLEATNGGYSIQIIIFFFSALFLDCQNRLLLVYFNGILLRLAIFNIIMAFTRISSIIRSNHRRYYVLFFFCKDIHL